MCFGLYDFLATLIYPLLLAVDQVHDKFQIDFVSHARYILCAYKILSDETRGAFAGLLT